MPGASVWAQADSSSPPLTYEVLINGESFQVEGNRLVKLQSKEKPGTSYRIAIRVAPTQVLRLNTVLLEYDMPAKVSDDGRREQRTVRLQHELGYSMWITDLGQPSDAKGQAEALKVLTDSVAESYRQSKAVKVEVGKASEKKFAGSTAQCTVIRCQDAQGFKNTCLACVLSGEKYAVTCVIQYLDKDENDVKPLFLKTLNSIRPIP
jgi:hypothetical protein